MVASLATNKAPCVTAQCQSQQGQGVIESLRSPIPLLEVTGSLLLSHKGPVQGHHIPTCVGQIVFYQFLPLTGEANKPLLLQAT